MGKTEDGTRDQVIEVNVPPARSRRSSFRALKIYAGGLVLALIGLGMWKAWELMVQAQAWYGVNRGLVNAVLVLLVVLAFAFTVVGLTARVKNRSAQRQAARASAPSAPTSNPAVANGTGEQRRAEALSQELTAVRAPVSTTQGNLAK